MSARSGRLRPPPPTSVEGVRRRYLLAAMVSGVVVFAATIVLSVWGR